jgi:hypothetical protein
MRFKNDLKKAPSLSSNVFSPLKLRLQDDSFVVSTNLRTSEIPVYKRFPRILCYSYPAQQRPAVI